jgi:hypothetical protein
MSSPSSGTTGTQPNQAAGGDPITALGISGLTAGIAIVPIIFTIVFHAGAAYMSYQRNQSIGWAILHFFFAVFYYPYYAFTQTTPAAPASTGLLPTVQTAGRKMKHLLMGGKRK